MESQRLPPVREVAEKYGLMAKKSLGQHFLFDLNITLKIAKAAGNLSEGTIFEIGPGPGGLTRSILSAGACNLIAIERDDRCIEALQVLSTFYEGKLTIVSGDALKIDIANMGTTPRRIIANLPYNISTVLLVKWLENARNFSEMILMFQKEVGDRIAAPTRSEHYGRLSVVSQIFCEVSTVFDIPPSAFVPPPKVTSTVIKLIPRETPLENASFKYIEQVTAAAFGQRRKMLRVSLKSLGFTSEILEKLQINPQARAEELSPEVFAVLANYLQSELKVNK